MDREKLKKRSKPDEKLHGENEKQSVANFYKMSYSAYPATDFMRNKRLPRLILLLSIIALIAVLTSCSGLIFGMYGMKKPKPVDEVTIARFAGKYNIPPEDSYLMDTSFVSWLFEQDTSLHKWGIKDHYQPLQALYYNQMGELVSFQVNCYAGGFPNLQWERDSIFNTFPPLGQAKVDSLLPLGKLLTFIRPVGNSKPVDTEDLDYFIVVQWNRFMGRQSKRLIRLVQHNSLLAKEVNFKIIYVNTDNNFAFAEIGK